MKKIIFWFVLVIAIGMGFFLWNQSEAPYQDKTEDNFQRYKEQRQEIIRMLTSGELIKEADRYGNEGFSFYYTPLN